MTVEKCSQHRSAANVAVGRGVSERVKGLQ